MSGDLESRTWGRHVTATAEEKTAATRFVASKAVDADDCRLLLDVLGLLPKAVTEHGMAGYRQGCRCRLCKRANAARTRRQRAVTTTANAPINTTTRGTA
jgi:hypothetical protein